MSARRLEDPLVVAFRSHLAAHRTIQEARRDLLHAIRHSSCGVVFVVGATGVGKTTLLRKVESDLVEAAEPDVSENRGLIPVIVVEARAPAGSAFTWPAFFADALRALGDPHLDRLSLLSTAERDEEAGTFLRRFGTETERLRTAYERALEHRRPAAVLVDEGHSLTSVTAPKLQATMELIKSLTNVTGVPHVLVGTYTMQPLMWHSGQLARRTKIIHFRPYDVSSSDDLSEFASVLEFFEGQLPLKARPHLVDMTETLMEQSGGLVGIASSWLCEALGRALEQKSKLLEERHLRESALPPGAIKAIRSEADEGRRFVDTLLGGSWAPKPAATPAGAKAPRPPRKKRPAGKRTPIRDSVEGTKS